MQYIEATGRLEISVFELVAISRHHRATAYLPSEEECLGAPPSNSLRLCLGGREEPLPIRYEANCGPTPCTLLGEADALDDTTLTLIRTLPYGGENPPPETLAQLRGEGYCLLHMLYQTTGRAYTLRLLLVGRDSPAPAVKEETPTPEDTARFFDRLMGSLAIYAAPEIQRVTCRLPSMRKMSFPFGQPREGQRELMETVYTTLGRGKRLYACAPTGIGKTVSALFPALRLLGQGKCNRVFYLTPKGTAAAAAAAVIEKLTRGGASIKAVRLYAKETLCMGGRACRAGERCAFSPNAVNRLEEAARELLESDIPVVGEEELLTAARAWRVCPHELSLTYSTYCDVIIGDYNYLFDPRVALKRFFATGDGKSYFLIDEAHNLVDRAREIYSTSLSLSYFDTLLSLFDSPKTKEAILRVKDAFSLMVRTALRGLVQERPGGEKTAFLSLSDLPSDYLPLLYELAYALEDGLFGGARDRANGLAMRGACYEVRGLIDKLSLYDRRHVCFLTYLGGDLTCRTLCLDPSEVVSRRLSLGLGAVLFSATLTPVSYYREILGGEKSGLTLELPSPFEEKNLCVAVMDRLSARESQRAASMKDTLRAILTLVKAKPGNYMIFCPSYSYMEKLHGMLTRAVPGLPTRLQKKGMTHAEREEFLSAFDAHAKQALLGFCVLGGIYGEGVDLVGKRLIGAVVIGVGLPALSDDREAIRAYFDDKCECGNAYAYVYPGFNRMLQAAGRVIRDEGDRGVVLLIDDRFGMEEYRRLMPTHWHGLRYVGDLPSLTRLLSDFWAPKNTPAAPKKT